MDFDLDSLWNDESSTYVVQRIRGNDTDSDFMTLNFGNGPRVYERKAGTNVWTEVQHM